MNRRGPVLYKSNKFANRFLYEVLPDNSWKDKPCFIIGGGPSLKDFDWSRLTGYRTIGVNLAFTIFDPTITFSMDTRFLRWIEDGKYGPEVQKKWSDYQGYRVWLATYTLKLMRNIFIVKVHKDYNTGLRSFTFSLRQGIGHGNNSGYAALNLAVCLGANPIYLLGFDMSHSGGETHWHGGHPVRQRENTVLKFIKHFNEAAPEIAEKGFKVINLNPDSRLLCFPRIAAEEVI